MVIAFDKARAEETPFPPPDMSSPKSSFANLSFIISISTTNHKEVHVKSRVKKHILPKVVYLYFRDHVKVFPIVKDTFEQNRKNNFLKVGSKSPFRAY